MTISLNPLFATTTRQNVQLAEETPVSATVNPFAELLAAQLQPPVAGFAPAVLKEDLPAVGSDSAGAALPGDVSLLMAAGATGPTVLNPVASAEAELAAGLPDGKAIQSQLTPWQVASAPVTPLAAATTGNGDDMARAASDQSELLRATLVSQQLVSAGSSQSLNEAAVDVGSTPLASLSFPAEIRSAILKTVANDRPASKLSESVESTSPVTVKDLVSLVTSGLPEGKAKDSSDVLAAMTRHSRAETPEPVTTGGLKDKGFAVRVEAEMAMASSARDALGPAMTQSPLTAQGGQVMTEPLTASIAEPMAKVNAWGEAFGRQLISTAAAGLDKTTIQVNPEHLGPLEISITMNKEQAQIMVVAANPQARDIVEHHLPALSRMMEQAGLQLADAQVSSQQQGQNQGQEQGRRSVAVDKEAVAELNTQAEDEQEIVMNGLKIQA